jgi:hypothetical protein
VSDALYLVELSAYDIGGATTTTLRYANRRGHVTGPLETPANTVYRARVAQPINVARAAFRPGATSGRSVIGTGELLLHNEDGELDALLTDYALDGRTLTLRRGVEGAAYPSGFTTVGVYTMEQAEADGDRIRIRVKDPAFKLAQPLQETLYDGDNVAPDGLEGTPDDLKGKPKPWAAGVVRNATLPCVNEAKLIYQMHDGAVQSVEDVYDSGIALGTKRYLVVGFDGTNGIVKTSDDGGDGTWTTRSTGFGTDQIRCCAYGAGLFVIAGHSGKLYTSPDAITWTSRTANVGTDDILRVVWNGTIFLLTTDNNSAATSTDGITWTARTPGFSAATIITALAWGEGVFVAAGGLGQVRTTPDGVTWTSQTWGGGSVIIVDVTYNESRGGFVMVGYNGTVSTSPDGLAWALQTTDLPTTNASAIGASNETFALVQTGGALFRSTGGAGWVQQDVSVTTNTANRVRYEGAYFWFCGLSGTLKRAGANAATWEDVPTGFGGSTFVYDICYGDALAQETYSSLADLEDDALAPGAGTAKYYLAGGYVRLGGTPAGAITADFTVGATSADRTAAQVWADILVKGGYTSADLVAADLTTLDAADNSEVGLFFGPDDRPSIGDALDMMAQTVGAWWGPRASDGDFRLVQWLAPSGTPALELGPNDIVENSLKLLASTDEGRGLPSTKTTLRYARNWTPQSDGLAEGVTDARRAYLAREWREAFDEDTAVATVHPLAPQTVEDTYYVSEADAQAEADRRQTLRGVWRQRYEVTVALTTARAALDIGDVVTLTHPRYGLSAGVDCRILGIVPDAARDRLTLTLWG